MIYTVLHSIKFGVTELQANRSVLKIRKNTEIRTMQLKRQSNESQIK